MEHKGYALAGGGPRLRNGGGRARAIPITWALLLEWLRANGADHDNYGNSPATWPIRS